MERVQIRPYTLSFLIYCCFFAELIPNGQYNGQKLIRLVSTNTAARTKRIIPKVPVTTFVKNKTTNTTATNILITLSIVPMFFFIFFFK